MRKAVDVQAHDSTDDDQLNTTINTTPLVDVMLVLLIIFLVTIPVLVPMHKVDLPNVRNIASQTKPENITIVVAADGTIYYQNAMTDLSQVRVKLAQSLRAAVASGAPIPEVQIRGDKATRFQEIGRVILACQQAGVPKVGFITMPMNKLAP